MVLILRHHTIEHKKECTGVKKLSFLYDLKGKYCHKDERQRWDSY
jgi:hypothetical protein